jgi:LuxR family maltose regulon positive regulatory protein
MPTPLLITKLHIPPTRVDLVARPRLMEQLEQGSQVKLTLVSAPAGYGKSTLASEWARQTRLPVAWLTLDPGDNDLKRWVTYLVAAIQTIAPEFGEMTGALLEGPQPSPPQPVLTALVNELDDLQRLIALVLDDYHVITNPAIHEAIAFLLEHLPEFIHLVILTRADPPLPLARIRAQNQLVEIRADDLRFTAEEASAFINEIMGLGLSRENIRTLEARTEGWISGLQLAAISMQGLDAKQLADFLAGFTGGYHYIVDYLMEEVLERQPDAMREFLLQTSILERMTGGLCDALTGGSNGQRMLERLEKRNLFIVPLDEERQWYRYHQLLADVLQNQLQQSYPEPLPDLHRRASQWFENKGFLEEAISHAVKSKDIERTTRLIEQNAMAMLMQGELVTLLNWIKPIENLAGDRPWLSTYKSWALTLSGQLDLAEDWLRKAESAIPPSSFERYKELMGHIEAIRAYIAEARGEASQTIKHAQKALEFLPESNQAVRSVVTFTLGTAYRLIGDHTKATQALKAARRTARIAGNRYLELGAVFTLADLTFDHGELHKAFDMYQETLRLATRPGGQKSPAAGMAYFGLGLIHYEWNDLEAALENTLQAIDLCQQWGHFVNLAASLVLLSRLKQAQGDLDSAQQAILKAEELTRSHTLALRAESWVTGFRAGLWLAQGNLEAANRWAKECGLGKVAESSYLREAEYLSLVRVYLATEQSDRALELTRELQSAAEASGRIGNVIETLVLRALAYQAKDDFSQALTALEWALTLAQPEGYIRVFLNEGTLMAELLRRAGSQGIKPQFVAELLSEFVQISGSEDSHWQPLIEPLSERELEILQLLADGLSNLDIAERLVITAGTVKAHTASIYRKLNVNSRSQAAAQARKLGLL